jgi:hypothetical protein
MPQTALDRDDARLCAFARAYQEKTGFHRRHPELPPK